MERFSFIFFTFKVFGRLGIFSACRKLDFLLAREPSPFPRFLDALFLYTYFAGPFRFPRKVDFCPQGALKNVMFLSFLVFFVHGHSQNPSDPAPPPPMPKFCLGVCVVREVPSPWASVLWSSVVKFSHFQTDSSHAPLPHCASNCQQGSAFFFPFGFFRCFPAPPPPPYPKRSFAFFPPFCALKNFLDAGQLFAFRSRTPRRHGFASF